MEVVLNFLAEHYIWFFVAAGVLILAIIGFLIDSKRKDKTPKETNDVSLDNEDATSEQVDFLSDNNDRVLENVEPVETETPSENTFEETVEEPVKEENTELENTTFENETSEVNEVNEMPSESILVNDETPVFEEVKEPTEEAIVDNSYLETPVFEDAPVNPELPSDEAVEVIDEAVSVDSENNN